MANTVTRGGAFLTLTGIDTDVLSEDLWPEQTPAGIPVISIDFTISAGTDKCIVREGSLTGPIIFSNIAGEHVIKPFSGKPIRPCLDISEGSYGATAALIIHIGDAG
jgi:hypothetical protein